MATLLKEFNAKNGLSINGTILSDGSRNLTANTVSATTFTGALSGTASKATNIVGGNSTTLLGSIPYQSNTDTTTLLAPNTSSNKRFLTMTGTGTNGAAPGWNAIVDGDVPSALTGKTYNGLTLTAAATGFTVAGGTTSKTLTMSNTLTFTGTDGSSVAFGAGGTVAYTGNKLSVFASTTSAELAGVLSDETGYTTGAVLMFNVSPSVATSLNASTTSFALLNTTATSINFGGAATSMNIGYTGSATATTSLAAGNTASGSTNTINIGTAGQPSSTTNVNLGSTAGGTITCNSNTVVSGNLTIGGSSSNTITFTGSIASDVTFASGGTRYITGDTAPSNTQGVPITVRGGFAGTHTGTAWAGGGVTLIGGLGNSPSTNGTAGNGGTVTINGGTAGSATATTAVGSNTAGAGGAVTILSGAGGAASGSSISNNAAPGGALSITAGNGGTGTAPAGASASGGNGGTINITAGTGGFASGGASQTYGSGGSINLTAGDSGGSTSNAGSITINAGVPGGSAYSSTINIGTATGAYQNKTINIGNSTSADNVNLITSSRILVTGRMAFGVVTVSAAGGTQGAATAIAASVNFVVVNTATATTADGVVLPTTVTGHWFIIKNTSAATIKVYPPVGGKINALATNAAFTIAAGSAAEFFADSTTTFQTV